APPQWIHRAGNFFHIKTQNFIIKNALLFKKGERVNALKMSETERIIRQIGYVYDARINVDTLTHTSDSVDVTIVAQDIWSISGSVSLQNFSSKQLWAITGIKSSDEPVYINGQIGVRDVNFLGLGTELSLLGKRNNLYPTGYNWDGQWNIANIGKTFLSSKIYRNSQPNLINYGVSIGRLFFSPVIRWAGGLTLDWVTDATVLREKDSLLIRQNVNFDRQDGWVGYAFPLDCGPDGNSTRRFVLSAGLTRTNYTKRPAVDTFFQFQDNRLYLIQFGYVSRKFYKDNYLFGLGRTEDVPAGGYFAILAGYQDGEKLSRPYVGIRAGKGIYNYKTGFFYAGMQAGTFFSQSIGQTGVVAADFQYFGRLYKSKNWKFRHLFWLRYAYGDDPLVKNRMFNINDYNGIRGFNANNLFVGNQRLTLNIEANIHMPFNILGFRFAWVLFADFALLAKEGQNIFQSQLFQGYGIGLRFRNEHMLFFNTLQIQFTWFPDAQNVGVPPSTFADRNPEFYRFNQFDASKPSIIGY
ncbi:MAG: hypothetical protein K2Q22_12390, partial [Cytophagales bacterium]|nr:hypothetical protein [Cytophagales bacterium]